MMQACPAMDIFDHQTAARKPLQRKRMECPSMIQHIGQQNMKKKSKSTAVNNDDVSQKWWSVEIYAWVYESMTFLLLIFSRGVGVIDLSLYIRRLRPAAWPELLGGREGMGDRIRCFMFSFSTSLCW